MKKILIATVAACTATGASVAAGIPVIDVTAVANLIQQVAYWQQQITAMSNQLSQMQQTHAAMTGPRGMHAVLPTTEQQRNYLPGTYAELMNTASGNSTTYAGLAERARAAMISNAVLTSAQLTDLSSSDRQLLEQRRRSSALLSTFAQTAYQQTSQRFAALQSMVWLIATATDQKAILDLQGRINAEQVLLTNEQTKLQALYQALQAEQIAEGQRVRERVIAGHGSFRTRFSTNLQGDQP